MKTKYLYTPFLYIPLLLGAATLQAQNPSSSIDEVETITITADLSDRDLSDLPTTAVVVNEYLIAEKEARHLQDLVSIVPNLNFSSGASRGKFIQIRGIGERSQFAEPINPSIGLILDDLDISGIGALATVFDLSQVEVLSGPQSVATGMNSLGGIVKLVSNQASDELYARVQLSAGQYGESRIGGVFNNSLNDSTNARFSIQSTKSDGFVQNTFLGRDDTNNIDELTVTGKFAISLNENNNIDLNLYHFNVDNGYDAFSLDNDNKTLSDEPGFDRAKGQAASIKLSSDFSHHTLQVLLSSIAVDTDYGYDEDWTHVGFHPFEYSSFDRYKRSIDRTNLDVKLANSKKALDASYLIGVNYSAHDEDLTRIYTFLDSDYSSNYKPTSQSIYGQYSVPIGEQFSITGAARLENFTADFEDIQGYFAEVDDNLFAASVAVDYKNDNNLYFVSVSRGYKAGGFNIDQRLAVNNRSFDPEYNENLELGLKSLLLDGALNVNLTLFYMQRKDAQVSDFAVLTNLDESGSTVTSFIDVIGNAGSGVNKGIELSSVFDISQSWFVQMNLGYLSAKFNDYSKIDGTFETERQQAQAPRYTAYLSSSYKIGEDWTWFIDADFKDDFGFSDGHDERAPSTTVVNTNISWQQDAYKINFWLKNVFDRTIFTRGFGGFSNDPRDEYAFAEPYYQFGQQRQFGLSFEYTWE